MTLEVNPMSDFVIEGNILKLKNRFTGCYHPLINRDEEIVLTNKEIKELI